MLQKGEQCPFFSKCRAGDDACLKRLGKGNPNCDECDFPMSREKAKAPAQAPKPQAKTKAVAEPVAQQATKATDAKTGGAQKARPKAQKEIIAAIAANVPGVNKHAIKEILDYLCDYLIPLTIQSEGCFSLAGVGKWQVVRRAPHKFHNIMLGGECCVAPARNAVKFTPFQALKEAARLHKD